jgi:hypothetical protein
MTDYETKGFQLQPTFLFATTSRLVLGPHSHGVSQLQILSPGVMRPKREAKCVELYISTSWRSALITETLCFYFTSTDEVFSVTQPLSTHLQNKNKNFKFRF